MQETDIGHYRFAVKQVGPDTFGQTDAACLWTQM
jgi:hypothetical protein